MDKLIKKYRTLVILGVLALAFLAIWFGMSGGQRTEADYLMNEEKPVPFKTGEVDVLRENNLKPLPFDGLGINAEPKE